jgi:hypothetical protein
MFLPLFTIAHTAISVIAILAGIPVVAALVRGHDRAGLAALFLATAAITSASGFGFPFFRLLPSHVIGAIALAVLAATVIARYAFSLAGTWRRIYAAGAVASLYFLIFVLIAQAFGKIAGLRAIAPTLSETPFMVTQAAALAVFVVLCIAAARKFHPAAMPGAAG